MSAGAPRFVFQVFRDPDLRWVAYEPEDIASASHGLAEDDGIHRLTLRMRNGEERQHLVQRGAAIFVCETLANRRA